MEKLHLAIKEAVDAANKERATEYAEKLLENTKEQFASMGAEDKQVKLLTEKVELAMSKTEIPELKVEIDQEKVDEIIKEEIPEVTALPEALATLFADAKAPAEEEINGIINAVESDKINKTLATVNTHFADREVKVTLDDLNEAKTHLNQATFEKAIEGDAGALAILEKFIPQVEAPEIEEESVVPAIKKDPIVLPTEEVKILSPEEKHKQEEQALVEAYETKKAELIEKGVAEAEAEKKAVEWKANIAAMVNGSQN